MNILIVEDDLTTSTMLSGVLQQLGYTVKVAKDGSEGWQETVNMKQTPKIILLDRKMPKMDGLTLCQKIRESQYSSSTYIIMLTAKESSSDIKDGFDAGADDYIPKPFNIQEAKIRISLGERILGLHKSINRGQ